MPKLVIKRKCFECGDTKKVGLKLKDTNKEFDGKPICVDCSDNTIEFNCYKCNKDFICTTSCGDEFGNYPNGDIYCFDCWEIETANYGWCITCKKKLDWDENFSSYQQDEFCDGCFEEQKFCENCERHFEPKFMSKVYTDWCKACLREHRKQKK